MMTSLDSLAALGPGLGVHLEEAFNLGAFAQRRVEHLREKVEAGMLHHDKLHHRLLNRFGPSAESVVGDDGVIDFNQLKKLVIQQQAARLQARLEGLFGEQARGTIGLDGAIDQDKLDALHKEATIDHVQARLTERFGDRAVGDDGSIDTHALRELLILDEDEQSFGPSHHIEETRQPAINDQPIRACLPCDLSRSETLLDVEYLPLETQG